MKYSQLSVQTQRAAPAELRTPGLAYLYRAGYLSREGQALSLAQQSIERMCRLAAANAPREALRLLAPAAIDDRETGGAYLVHPGGESDLLVCPGCGYAARRELARSARQPFSREAPLPLEKVSTPECGTIAQLAAFLNIPPEKTAKALMFTRLSDAKFVFVVIRGDLQLSEARLAASCGPVRMATPQEILAAGAVPGYASPVGLRDAMIVADSLVAVSPNLAAGANEAGYHLLNTNLGRDYQPDLLADLSLAGEGDPCPECSSPLASRQATAVYSQAGIEYDRLLLALAEINHDEKGLTLPACAAPFDVYLMNVPGKTVDTSAAAAGIYESLSSAGLQVLYDDRDERAGVKFNDADLIGCPLRVTVGERGLQSGMVELKPRLAAENTLVSIPELVEKIKSLL